MVTESLQPADGSTTNNKNNKYGIGWRSPPPIPQNSFVVMVVATKQNRGTCRKTNPTATMCNTNLISIALGLIPGLCAKKPPNQLPESPHDRKMA
jgi:hypothetical protein